MTHKRGFHSREQSESVIDGDTEGIPLKQVHNMQRKNMLHNGQFLTADLDPISQRQKWKFIRMNRRANINQIQRKSVAEEVSMITASISSFKDTGHLKLLSPLRLDDDIIQEET